MSNYMNKKKKNTEILLSEKYDRGGNNILYLSNKYLGQNIKMMGQSPKSKNSLYMKRNTLYYLCVR